MDPITKEQFQAALPPSVKKSVHQTVIDDINNIIADPESLEVFRENLLTYGSVMKDGRFKITSYIYAVKYVSFKLLGKTNKDAYIATFPDKYQKFLLAGVPEKDIASYSTAYNKSKLVNLIFEQTLVPTHVLNAPVFQSAINVQVDLMTNATSEKVRCEAANSLLVHLKRPEKQVVELDIGIDQGSVIDDYQIAMRQMVIAQKELIGKGGDVLAITNAKIKVVNPNED